MGNNGTFDGTHRPIGNKGRAHSPREASDRAGFDNAPAPCLIVMVTFLTMVVAVLTGVAL